LRVAGDNRRVKHRTAIFAAALTAAALGGASSAHGELVSADANILLAEKFLGYHDWGPNDRQGEIGLLTNWQRRGWPVAIAADFLAASREASFGDVTYTNQQARTFELDLGARKLWTPIQSLHVFAGGGPSLMYAYLDNITPSGNGASRSTGQGFWLDAGIVWTLTQVFNLGVDGRYSYGTVRIFGIDRNAGGLHVGIFGGYHFGS
jgi:hypothetical protein